MNLVGRQAMVQEHIERIAKDFSESLDRAFLRFAYTAVAKHSVYDVDDNDIVDGGQDKQIDVIGLDVQMSNATVYLVQAKNTHSFSTNSLIQMRNGLHWVINRPIEDVDSLGNERLRNRIHDFREKITEVGPMAIDVVAVYATNGLTSDIAKEFNEELQTLIKEFDNNQFASFQVRVVGASELIDEIYASEQSQRKITTDVEIVYDHNAGSLIEYSALASPDNTSQLLGGLVCTVKARDIANIVNSHDRNTIFEPNVRSYLKDTKINQQIMDTCTDAEECRKFWFLNNGITIVCEKYERMTNQAKPFIRIHNLRIVNGCQTAETLASAARSRKRPLQDETQVLVRIYRAPTSDMIQKITLTTNSQNKISVGLLKANNPEQRDLEEGFRKYNLFYERKPHQYDVVKPPKPRVAANSFVAQCYLAVVDHKPFIARTKNSAIWEEEWYSRIFKGGIAEPYVIAWQIVSRTEQRLKQVNNPPDSDIIRRKVAASGHFYVARMVSYLWRRTDDFSVRTEAERKQLVEQVLLLDTDATVLDDAIKSSYDHLCNIIADDKRYKADVEKALKTSTLQDDIDEAVRNGDLLVPVATNSVRAEA